MRATPGRIVLYTLATADPVKEEAIGTERPAMAIRKVGSDVTDPADRTERLELCVFVAQEDVYTIGQTTMKVECAPRRSKPLSEIDQGTWHWPPRIE